MNDVPVFITYRDRRTMLDTTLKSLLNRGFTDITVINNDSAESIDNNTTKFKVIRTDNRHRHLSPWLDDIVPSDGYYIVMDCDNELVCPDDVCDVLRDILERHPELPKVGLGIKTDDLLFPPPQHYSYSYLMEYSVENGTRFKEIDYHLGANSYTVIDAPIDTTFAMYRPGSGWPGIVGARTTAPYHIRHLSWYNAEYTEEEKLYYARAGKEWTMGHSAGSLLDTTIAVPFTDLKAGTVVALHGETVRYAPMLLDDSYFELLSDLWTDGRSFVIVEHDIVVNETTIDELKLCENDWCAMPFSYRGNDYAYSLACTKFSAALIRRHPDLMQIISQMTDTEHPPKHWCRMDMWIYMVLTELGEKRCEHSRATPLVHIGEQVPKHGCAL